MVKSSQQRVRQPWSGIRHTPLTLRPTATALAVATCFSSHLVFANPTAPVVVNGSASFAQAGNILNITNSPNAIINWGSFSIGANELTRFIQQSASSAVLNRVIGQDPSAILGALQSNGRVFLLNPNGIVFGAGSQVNVAGLVASTLNLSNEDFLANRMRFTDGVGAGSVVNSGSLTGGSVYLIGNAVTNNGLITSPQGEVVLAAGNSVELVSPGTPNLRVEVVAPDNAARSLGTITADAGRIGIYAGLVSNSGTLNASSAVAEGGRIVLKATKNTTLASASILDASGVGGGRIDVLAEDTVRVDGRLVASAPVAGNGGFIETSGKSRVTVADSAVISTKSAQGHTGTWLIDPNNFVISATGGDTTGSAISSNLASTDVVITSTSGSGAYGGAQVGDIIVDDAIPDWNSANTLTLTAVHDVKVNQTITNTGAGGLNLYAGWDGVSSATAPTLNAAGTVLVNAAIDVGSIINIKTSPTLGAVTILAPVTANGRNDPLAFDPTLGTPGANAAITVIGNAITIGNSDSLSPAFGWMTGKGGTGAIGTTSGTAQPAGNADVVITGGIVDIGTFGRVAAYGGLASVGPSVTSGVGGQGGNATVSITGSSITNGGAVWAFGGDGGFGITTGGQGGDGNLTLTSTGAISVSGVIQSQGGVGGSGSLGAGGTGGNGTLTLSGTGLTIAGGVEVDGGYGGSGGTGVGGNGGNALMNVTATGGDITLTGSLSATGGFGGFGGSGATGIFDGGNGGTATLNMTASGGITFNAPPGSGIFVRGGQGRTGGSGFGLNPNGGDGGNGGAATLNITSNGASGITLQAGTVQVDGGEGGSGGFGASGGTSGGAGGRGGNGGTATAQIRANGGNLAITGAVLHVNGGLGGIGGQGGMGSNEGGSGAGGNGGAGGTGGAAALTLRSTGSGQLSITGGSINVNGGRGGNGGSGGTLNSGSGFSGNGGNGGNGGNATLTMTAAAGGILIAGSINVSGGHGGSGQWGASGFGSLMGNGGNGGNGGNALASIFTTAGGAININAGGAVRAFGGNGGDGGEGAAGGNGGNGGNGQLSMTSATGITLSSATLQISGGGGGSSGSARSSASGVGGNGGRGGNGGNATASLTASTGNIVLQDSSLTVAAGSGGDGGGAAFGDLTGGNGGDGGNGGTAALTLTATTGNVTLNGGTLAVWGGSGGRGQAGRSGGISGSGSVAGNGGNGGLGGNAGAGTLTVNAAGSINVAAGSASAVVSVTGGDGGDGGQGGAGLGGGSPGTDANGGNGGSATATLTAGAGALAGITYANSSLTAEGGEGGDSGVSVGTNGAATVTLTTGGALGISVFNSTIGAYGDSGGSGSGVAGGTGGAASLTLTASGASITAGQATIEAVGGSGGFGSVFGAQGVATANLSASGDIVIGDPSQVLRSLVQASGGALTLTSTAGSLLIQGGQSLATSTVSASGVLTLDAPTGAVTLQGGQSGAGALARGLATSTGPTTSTAVTAGTEVNVLGGSSSAQIYGESEVRMVVGGAMTGGGGAINFVGPEATISAGTINTIFVDFPNLASGGYLVNGNFLVADSSVQVTGASGFYTAGSAGTLGSSLIITYGLTGPVILPPPPPVILPPEPSLTPPTQILIVAMGDSITPPEPEKNKDIFEDIKHNAPICR